MQISLLSSLSILLVWLGTIDAKQTTYKYFEATNLPHALNYKNCKKARKQMVEQQNVFFLLDEEVGILNLHAPLCQQEVLSVKNWSAVKFHWKYENTQLHGETGTFRKNNGIFNYTITKFDIKIQSMKKNKKPSGKYALVLNYLGSSDINEKIQNQVKKIKFHAHWMCEGNLRKLKEQDQESSTFTNLDDALKETETLLEKNRQKKYKYYYEVNTKQAKENGFNSLTITASCYKHDLVSVQKKLAKYIVQNKKYLVERFPRIAGGSEPGSSAKSYNIFDMYEKVQGEFKLIKADHSSLLACHNTAVSVCQSENQHSFENDVAIYNNYEDRRINLEEVETVLPKPMYYGGRFSKGKFKMRRSKTKKVLRRSQYEVAHTGRSRLLCMGAGHYLARWKFGKTPCTGQKSAVRWTRILIPVKGFNRLPKKYLYKMASIRSLKKVDYYPKSFLDERISIDNKCHLIFRDVIDNDTGLYRCQGKTVNILYLLTVRPIGYKPPDPWTAAYGLFVLFISDLLFVCVWFLITFFRVYLLRLAENRAKQQGQVYDEERRRRAKLAPAAVKEVVEEAKRNISMRKQANTPK